MKAKVKEFFTIIASIALVATISYSAIHIYQYIVHYGSLMEIPREVAVPFMELVFPIFAVITIVIIVLLAGKKGTHTSEDEQDEEDIEVPSKAQHIYSLDTEDQRPEPVEEEVRPEIHISKEEYDFFNTPQVVQQETAEASETPEPEMTAEKEEVPEEPLDAAQPEAEVQAVPEAEELQKEEQHAPETEMMIPEEKVSDEKKSKLPEDDFHKRLEEEVNFSNDKNYELTLLLLNIDPKKYSSDFDVFRQSLTDFFNETAFIYDYNYKNTVAVILPFFSYQESQQELIELYNKIKTDLQSRSTVLRAGFSSKFNRSIDSETLLYESEVAFKKAIEEQGFCILGFEPDINKYEQYYSS